MKFHSALLAPVLACAALPAIASAEAESNSIPMTFEACLAKKESVIAALGVQPSDIKPIVNTGVLTMTRVCTTDGSVLITCNAADQKMIVTKSSKGC